MAKKKGSFFIGEAVGWTSQSQGYVKRKFGTVSVVVPAGMSPFLVLVGRGLGHEQAAARLPRNVGANRDHTSYLIQVGLRQRLYWPQTRHLHRHGEKPPVQTVRHKIKLPHGIGVSADIRHILGTVEQLEQLHDNIRKVCNMKAGL
jgi:hypothetical protein